MARTSAAERFWSHVDRRGPTDCWPWMGSPFTYRDRRGVRVGRMALELSLGRPLGPKAFACHTCDNPPCCNPRHLYEGDAKSNAMDATWRGRNRVGRQIAFKRKIARALEAKGEAKLDRFDLDYWRFVDRTAAAAEIAATVARVERGELSSDCRWFEDVTA